MSIENGNDKGIAWNMVHRSPWWVPWVFLFLLWFGWAIYQFHTVSAVSEVNREARSLIRTATIESCERVNDVRRESNARSEILRDVLEVASNNALERGETDVAALYIEHRQSLGNHEIVDCDTAFPEEMERAGFVASELSAIPTPVDAENQE